MGEDDWLEAAYEDRHHDPHDDEDDFETEEIDPDEDIDWDGGPVDFTETWM